MAKYIKPDGTEVDVNDNSADHAKSLGWVPADEKPKPKPKAKSK